MKYLVIALLAVGTFAACKKKDTYGYTCNCKNKSTQVQDTTFTVRVETSGEAQYICRNTADTMNKYGGNVSCNVE